MFFIDSAIGICKDTIYINGILTLVRSYENVFSPVLARTGFECCGQSCDPDENDGLSISFDMIMQQCYTDVPTEQLEHMQRVAPDLAEIVKLKGTVTYEDFIEHGIHPGPTSINRSDLNHVRHWSEIINHEETIKRFEQEVLEKNPETIERRKREAAAIIFLEKENKEQERKRQTTLQRAQKLLAKDAETKRFASLSAKEKLEEKRAQKTARVAATALKVQQKQAEIDNAKLLVMNMNVEMPN